MKRILFCFLFALLFVSCEELPFSSDGTKVSKIDKTKAAILQLEKKQLPLFMQAHNNIHSIVIDSVVIVNCNEPYNGYLVTTWDFTEEEDHSYHSILYKKESKVPVRKTQTVYVELTDIYYNRVDGCRWRNEWEKAYNQVNSKASSW